jgi:hypothetical protein
MLDDRDFVTYAYYFCKRILRPPLAAQWLAGLFRTDLLPVLTLVCRHGTRPYPRHGSDKPQLTPGYVANEYTIQPHADDTGAPHSLASYLISNTLQIYIREQKRLRFTYSRVSNAPSNRVTKSTPPPI